MTPNPPAPAPGSKDVLFGIPAKGPALMTVDEVAGILRFDRSTVYDMVTVGELEMHRRPGAMKSHQRITRRSLITRMAVMAQYEAQEAVLEVVRLGAATLTPDARKALAERLLRPDNH